MPDIVGIQFKGTGKIYYFSPNGVEFSVGDGAIVETARGVEYGKVAFGNKTVDDDKIVGSLKNVIRKADEKDKQQYLDNLAKRDDAMAVAREKIAAHGLEMKLVDAEYTFDCAKLIFSFTAENRVDFRNLVKDLASHFRTRIELRQIGIRDECKMKGGLGPCGRPCCCNCFNGEFERVSIKMAKNQGLSLNPTKISGLCGRLMCCLKYEDDYYAETIKFMPKIGSEIVTPDGAGVVTDSNVLKQTVKAKISLKNGDVEVREYPIKDLIVEGNAEQDSAEDDDITDESESDFDE